MQLSVLLRAILKVIRPYQWTKNFFVFVGLIFGHAFGDAGLVRGAILGFIAFCLIASTVYVMNDIFDRDSDRQHPKKKSRPIASGALSVRLAIVLALSMGASAIIIAASLSRILLTLLFVYLSINILYSTRLKHEAILDVFIIASGFVLRILAGTIGIGIDPSDWLLLTGTSVSLFLGFVKRRAEMLQLGDSRSETRRVLQSYQPAALDQAITISATITIISYALYTMSERTTTIHGSNKLIYTVPIVMYCLMRYLHLLHRNVGGADPARDLVKDPHIVIGVIAWIALTAYLIL